MEESERATVTVFVPTGEVRPPKLGEFYAAGHDFRICICEVQWGVAANYAICRRIELPTGKLVHALVETEDAAEATHWTFVDGFQHYLACRGLDPAPSGARAPWYKLIPLTPPEPTPEEIAAKVKEAAWNAFAATLIMSPDNRKVFDAGWDAREAKK